MPGKKNDGWDDVPGGGEKRQGVECSNGWFGCGQSFEIVKWIPDSQTFEAKGFAPHVRLCLPCANRIAHRWGVPFEDLDYLMTAFSCVVGSKRALDAADKTAIRERLRFMQVHGKDQTFKEKVGKLIENFLRRGETANANP